MKILMPQKTSKTNHSNIQVKHTIPMLYKKGVNTSSFITSPGEFQPPKLTGFVSKIDKKTLLEHHFQDI